MRLDTILVPTDFSETADHAEAQAVELAARHGARIELFHVVEPYGEPPENMMAIVRDYLAKLERDAEDELAAKARALQESSIEASYTKSHHLPPSAAIADKVQLIDPDLVVMGTHGRRGFQHLVLGSVAERVLRTVPVSVLTLSLEAPLVPRDRCFARVLVAVDFSDCSKRALDAAFSVLVDGGEVEVVHVVATPVYPGFYPGPVPAPVHADPELPSKVRDHLNKWLDGRKAGLSIREGSVVEGILEVRDEADAQLIVMGTKGLTGLDHLLLGSVTEKVVRRARVPVLTVH